VHIGVQLSARRSARLPVVAVDQPRANQSPRILAVTLYVEIWLSQSQWQRAMVPAASPWSVCQRGPLYQHQRVITRWHRHLSAANLRHSFSAEHTPHEHARDCYHC